MTEDRLPAWLAAAVPAAVRLAAEAGAEVDDVLDDTGTGPGAARRLAQHVARIERSARPPEIATDLAALLWAECEDVPRIDDILEEPGAQAALEAVAEARRCAAERVAEAVASCRRATAAGSADAAGGSLSLRWAPPKAADLVAVAASPAAAADLPGAERPAPPGPVVAPDAPRTLGTTAASVRRSATGAAVAGAAATAILLFGRHLRRA